MKRGGKKADVLNVVANVNIIRSTFNKKSFKLKEFKEYSKKLAVPYPEKMLEGLRKKNKIEKLDKDEYRFKDTRPIFHFLIEEVLKEIQDEKHQYNHKWAAKKSAEKVDSSDAVPTIIVVAADPLTNAINLVKASGLKVLRQVITWEEI